MTTGGPTRWLDSNWYSSAGLRTRTTTGTELEVSQKIGYEDSNSLFVPPFQGTARLSLRMTKPLSNGAGPGIQYEPHRAGRHQCEHLARDSFSKDVQSLLFDVHRAYWDRIFSVRLCFRDAACTSKP